MLYGARGSYVYCLVMPDHPICWMIMYGGATHNLYIYSSTIPLLGATTVALHIPIPISIYYNMVNRQQQYDTPPTFTYCKGVKVQNNIVVEVCHDCSFRSSKSSCLLTSCNNLLNLFLRCPDRSSATSRLESISEIGPM